MNALISSHILIRFVETGVNLLLWIYACSVSMPSNPLLSFIANRIALQIALSACFLLSRWLITDNAFCCKSRPDFAAEGVFTSLCFSRYVSKLNSTKTRNSTAAAFVNVWTSSF